MSKTESGYSIRAQMLHLARDILSENTQRRLEAARRTSSASRFDGMADASITEVEGGPAAYTFTTEDVIREAEKFYAFVERNEAKS